MSFFDDLPDIGHGGTILPQGVKGAPRPTEKPACLSKKSHMDRPRSERKWHVKKIRLRDPDGEVDWLTAQDMTPDARMRQVDWLYVDAARWNGRDLSQQRLCRSVARVERRRR